MNINNITDREWTTLLRDLKGGDKNLLINRESGELLICDKSKKIHKIDFSVLDSNEISQISEKILLQNKNKEKIKAFSPDRIQVQKKSNLDFRALEGSVPPIPSPASQSAKEDQLMHAKEAILEESPSAGARDELAKLMTSFLDNEKLEEAIKLLDDHPDSIQNLVNLQGKNGLAVLHLAIAKNSIENITKLIDLGAKLDTLDKTDKSPLHLLAALENSPLLNILNLLVKKECGMKRVINFSENSLSEAIAFVAQKKVSVKEQFLEELYNHLMESRFEFLIQPDRSFPTEEDRRRTALFLKRTKTSVHSKSKNFKLEDLPEKAKKEGFEKWIQARTSLSCTVNRSGIDPCSAEESEKAKENWFKADQAIYDLAKSKIKLGGENICKIHGLLADGLSNNGGKAGQLRSSDINIGENNLIPGPLVSKKMNEYFQWLDQNIKKCEEGDGDPIEFAALAFQRLVSIHPFTDGNGRIARFVMDYILQRFGLPPPVLNPEISSACVFAEKSDDDPRNVHPQIAILNIYKGVLNSLEQLNEI